MSEQTYRAYLEDIGFSDKLRLGASLGALLVLGFLGLDYVVSPALFGTFVVIRVVAASVLVACTIVAGLPVGRRHPVWVGIVALLVPILSVALMVQLIDPVLSTYYQGITLALLFMPTFFVWNRVASGVVCVTAFASYVVPTVWRVGSTPELLPILVNNSFFLGSAALIIYFGSNIMYAARFNEFVSRRRLESARVDLEQSNRKLRELDQMKTRFFANVSHELRTPLTIMLAPLPGLIQARAGRGDVKEQDTLDTVRRNGLKLLKLINDLLDLTKLEAKKTRLKPRLVDLVAVCRDAVSSVQPLAEKRRLTVRFVCELARLEVFIDPEQFERVPINLLANAVKFSSDGGCVDVRLEQTDTEVRLVVEDRGEGIPPDMLEAIFDRFSQADVSPTRRHGGTGIGLSLVREIVELHAGVVWAEHRRNGGARLVVQLQKGDKHIPESVRDRRATDRGGSLKRRVTDQPAFDIREVVRDRRELQLSDLQPERVVEPTPGESGGHDKTVLVVDDNADVRSLLRSLFEGEYDVILAGSGAVALERLEAGTVDLVISDVMMPAMDGHELCRRIKANERFGHLPVMLVTARAATEMLVEGIDAGADDYLVKPFESVELRARVRSLLRMRAAEAQLASLNQNLRIRAVDLGERQRELFLATIKSLVSALEAKDDYTRHHSARVTSYALSLAKQMGFGERELKDLQLAGILHDIGKIGVRESTLNKPGRLTDDELAEIKAHPGKGESIIAPVVELRAVASVVRAHHERYDGSGYPDGLARHAIPVGARILAVADTYDAMTSDRPYRQGLAHGVAVKEILSASGKQFDPEIVEHFLTLTEEFRRMRVEGGAAQPPAATV